MPRIGPPELLIIALIIILLFGASRLPKLARSLREARDEFEGARDEEPSDEKSEKKAPEQSS